MYRYISIRLCTYDGNDVHTCNKFLRTMSWCRDGVWSKVNRVTSAVARIHALPRLVAAALPPVLGREEDEDERREDELPLIASSSKERQ